jgi:Zn-dependent peptidase ImmA (M78 family)/DNA-binding XRE family transcriptional regulator
MIADRIRQARLAAGLTLAELGAHLGVSHAAIQKFEKGRLTPSSVQLLQLARACGVRTEYFFRAHQVDLLQPEFRKRATFGKTAQAALTLRVAEAVEKRAELLGAFPESPLPRFEAPGGLPARIMTAEALEEVAEALRRAWQIGTDPIADFTDLLESRGLLVIAVDEPHEGFSGLTATARAADGRSWPVIAVSTRWPGDRQRFTLAHELGHLLLAGRLADDLDEERACDRFAGALLAPRAAVREILGGARRAPEWQELYGLKHEFGLSMGGGLQRARQCGVIDDAVYGAMIRAFSARGWRKAEPGTPLPQERPRLFEQLVYRALAEDYLSEARAAELLGLPLMRFHKMRQLEWADAPAHQ